MEINCQKQDKALVMTLRGRMDRVAAMEFDRSFSEYLKKDERKFVVDMEGLEYVSSAGLRSLLAANQQLQDNKGQIRLCNVNGLVKEVFAVSGFESLFDVYPSLAEAVNF
jgi:anti-anti-sigma factor